ncbi:MAG: hypothetical protein FJW23_10670, partial [Acidimicrobiia bacterium]|nr:hypothetical protein [Acidimicrobiia bacterium]
RRVIVFDAETGAFKRMWGAFGNPPDSDPPTPLPGTPAPAGAQAGGGAASEPARDLEGPGSPHFGNRVHGIRVSRDGLVYVADRSNRRVQVFTVDGMFVDQVFINRSGPSAITAAGLAFSPAPDQTYMYVADFGNSHVVVVHRRTLEVLYQFGARSSRPGDFQGLHHLAADSMGNLYTAEVAPGNRAQRFAFKGLSSVLPPNAVPADAR